MDKATMRAELKALREFRWNVLQAYERGGFWYLNSCVKQMIKKQALDPGQIIKDEYPYA